jgi:hypothetical protein
MGKYNLTDERLAEGLLRGDIFEGVDKQGRQIFGLQTMTHIIYKEKAKADNTSRSKNLKADELLDAQLDFQSLNLTQFQLKRPGSKAASASTSLPALLDRGVDSDLTKEEWEQAQAVLNSGKTDVGKYLKQLKGMLRDIGLSKPGDHIYLKLTLAFVCTVHIYMLQMQSHM